jgi:YidC/Oxa1 family membrane protein insertase
MQRSNLIVFIVLSALILGGWFWITNSMNPSQDLAKVDTKEQDEKARAAKEKANKQKAEKEKADQEKADKEKADKDKADKEPKKQVKERPAETVTLGGEGFHLTVKTTSRGAGVREVTLNRFDSADWRGRPKLDEDGNPVPLDLIQDDEFNPSFRMYHYLQPKDDNPVFGLGEAIWDFKRLAPGKDEDGNLLHQVCFWTTVPGMDNVKIVKTYSLTPQAYHVKMLLEIHDLRTDRNAAAIPFRYQLTGAQGIPIEGEWYTAIFRNAIMGVVDRDNNLWRKLEESARISPRRGGDRYPEGALGDSWLQFAGVANQYFAVMIVVDDKQPARDDGGTTKEKILAWTRPTLETTEKRGKIVKKADDTILFTDSERVTARYMLLPRTKKHLEDLGLNDGDNAVLSSYETPDGKRIASWVRLGDTLKPQFDDITVRVSSEVVNLAPNTPVKHQFLLYHGPVKAALLSQFSGDKEVPGDLVDRYTHTLHLRTLTDYHSDNWFGWISSKIRLTDLIILFTRLMHWLLNLLQHVFGYGLGIVVLTVIVRGMMFPISRKQALFSIKMQELAPELKKIQEKYPDDAQARMQATQEFYRKHGINPLGSCWPVFLQMPIFLGLYFALQESVHFRLADFLWIKNLAAPDMLIYWSDNIPIISSPDHAGGFLGVFYLGPYLNVLPVFAVVFMMIVQMQTMPPPTDDQQAMQQKMLKFMSIFFGIMFYKVAAGLCIYFITSSLWGMAERKLLPKKKPVAAFPGPAGSTPPGGTGSSGGGGAPVSKGPLTPKDKGKWGKKDKEKAKDKEAITTFDKLKALWREILKQAEKK